VIARLVDALPILGSTVFPAAVLLALGVLFQPQSVNRPRHRHGVRCTRVIRRLEAERARYRRPTGFASPAWTVQPREVTPA
jgi:hypothetical protein